MIEVKEILAGDISVKESLAGEINNGVEVISPSLIDLEVTPSKEKKTYKHEGSYGYDNVTVNPIPSEYVIPNGTLDITSNGTHNVNEYENVNVNVESIPNLQTKEITPAKEMQVVGADEEYDGLDAVVVNAIPDEYIVPSGELEIIESGTYDVKNYASANVNVSGGSGGAEGRIPVFGTEEIFTSLTGVTSARIANVNITSPYNANGNDMYNVNAYKRKPDLTLIFALVRGGSYGVSSNLTVIAETDWSVDSSGTIQKLIVLKADLTSTNDYEITQTTSGRIQYGFCQLYDAGEPEVVLNKIGASTETRVTATAPDDNLYMYFCSAIYSNGTMASQGILYHYYSGEVTYIDQLDRLFVCWKDRAGEIDFTFRATTPYYQFIGLKIPYKKA